jgi:hypothetical protein
MSAFVLVGLTLVACGADDVTEGPAQEDIDNESPYGAGVDVGEAFDYVLYTHCGVEWTRIDGVWWRTTPLNDGNANPPSGWGNPYDSGQLRIIDQTTAVYSGGPGVDIEFKRTDTVEPPFTCS